MARKSGNPRQNASKKIDSTNDLPEGATNLYYTKARSNTKVDETVDATYLQNLSNLDADLISEKPPQYYRRIIEDKNGTRIN